MKHSCIVVTLAGLLAASSLAIGQSPAPAPAPVGLVTPAPLDPAPAKPAGVRPNRLSKANADARACLDRGDNLQIIVCAERYR